MNTIEGAMVFTALTLTAGVLTGGIITLAQHASAISLARDAARAEAMGHDGAGLVASRDAAAHSSISHTTIGGVEAIQVEVTKDAALFTVTATAVTVAEPQE